MPPKVLLGTRCGKARVSQRPCRCSSACGGQGAISDPPQIGDLSFFFLFVFFFCSGPNLWHTEVPRLRVNQSYSCWPMPQPQPPWIQAASVTYAAAHGNTRSLTQLMEARDGTHILMDTSCVLNPLSHNGNSCFKPLFLEPRSLPLGMLTSLQQDFSLGLQPAVG